LPTFVILELDLHAILDEFVHILIGGGERKRGTVADDFGDREFDGDFRQGRV
jgi:hypothetical protein